MPSQCNNEEERAQSGNEPSKLNQCRQADDWSKLGRFQLMRTNWWTEHPNWGEIPQQTSLTSTSRWMTPAMFLLVVWRTMISTTHIRVKKSCALVTGSWRCKIPRWRTYQRRPMGELTQTTCFKIAKLPSFELLHSSTLEWGLHVLKSDICCIVLVFFFCKCVHYFQNMCCVYEIGISYDISREEVDLYIAVRLIGYNVNESWAMMSFITLIIIHRAYIGILRTGRHNTSKF